MLANTGTGVISVANANLHSGAPTPNSFVCVALKSDWNQLAIFLASTGTISLRVQVSYDEQTWMDISGQFVVNLATAVSGTGLPISAITDCFVCPVWGNYARVCCDTLLVPGSKATVSLIPGVYNAGLGMTLMLIGFNQLSAAFNNLATKL